MPWADKRLLLKKIIKKKADYVLAVKNNQELLFENIENKFRFLKEIKTDEDINTGHGQIETRKYSVIKNLQRI